VKRLIANGFAMLAVAAGLLLSAEIASGQTFTTLTNFQGSADGANPYFGYPILSGGNGYDTTSAGGTYDEGTIYKVTSGGTITVLYNFCSQINCTDGANPLSGLVVSGGNAYGTTYWGGAHGVGTIFEVTPSGTLTTLYSFCSQTNCADGEYPIAGLVRASNGNFYGATSGGGLNGGGTIFEITPGGVFTTLHSFCSPTDCTDGDLPYAGLLQAGTGNLYGTTPFGGANGEGTVFEITLAGQFSTLYSFCSQNYPTCTDGGLPVAGLILGNDGNLYGTTLNGGTDDSGTVFKITPAGQLTTLYSFCTLSGCTDGLHPYAGLLLASDGNFYGTTEGGFDPNFIFTWGNVFAMTPAGQVTSLHNFGVTDGAQPLGGLAEDTQGNLYGTTDFGGTEYNGTIFTLPVGIPRAPIEQYSGGTRETQTNSRSARSKGLISAPSAKLLDRSRPGISAGGGIGLSLATSVGARKASGSKAASSVVHPASLTNLLSFNGGNGAFPYYVSLIQGTDGNLYGTTESGGPVEQGTVFKVTTGGTLTTLYSFCSQINCSDGAEPFGGLIQASNGNFYGTTSNGGPGAVGTVFQITSVGQLNTLYTFCSQPGCADGVYITAPVIQGSDGNLYGTAYQGGAHSDAGTIFKLTLSGQLTTLYSFCAQTGCVDGSGPFAGLVQASNGNFYGTTETGGANSAGTVFEITPAGQFTSLYSFCSQSGCADGSQPRATLIQGSNGNFYGTTQNGGANRDGTVFEITPAGVLTTLYSFCAQTACADGVQPNGGLVQVGGNLYGTTSYGGSGFGTVFEISSTGQFNILYTFDFLDGGIPQGGLMQASNGNLYGMTNAGGNRLDGTIFSLPPVILVNPPSGTAEVGVAYSSALVASGGVSPYSFSITQGSLPPGLTLNSSTGAITGTPTTAGTYNFTAQVTDSKGNTATTGTSIAAIAALMLNGPTSTAQLGVPYNSALTASGGIAPYSFQIISGSLPSGLTLNTSTGAITGTPKSTGTFSFEAQVTDSQAHTATANCSIVVTDAGSNPTTTSLTLAPASLPVGSVGPVVMTATVIPTSGTGTPSGSVTFFSGSTQVGTVTVSKGAGSFSYNPSALAVGIYSITAVYSGDGTFSSSSSPAQTLGITQNGPLAYVANAQSNTLSVINIPTASVVSTIPVGSEPVLLAISPNGQQIYVSNFGANDVSVINTASNAVVGTIPVQSEPNDIAFTPDGSAAYVVNYASNTVSVVDTTSQTVTATIPVQTSPYGVAMAPTSIGTFVYVTNSGSNTVSVIAVASNTVVQTINVGTKPTGVSVSPNGSMVYVANPGSNSISVISVASNTVVATIPAGTSPVKAAFTPDGTYAYVANAGNSVSVIDTASNTVINTITGTSFQLPQDIALSPDGAYAFVANLTGSSVSVITTATNTVTSTVAVGSQPFGVATASAPPNTLQITQPLSPTQPNTFNFGSNNYAVQYPAGTKFSGVNMTVTQVEISQAQFQQRVAGTQFANTSCIVYAGAGGNCIDDEVTCSDNNGNSISCPSETQPTIAVQTSFATSQQILNPGYLTTPIGQNAWQNIFSGYSDPTVKGKTKGFSEFVAVNLGVTNSQGVAKFFLLYPSLPRTFYGQKIIPIGFTLKSVVNKAPVTDAQASITVVQIADAKGNSTNNVVLSGLNVFKQGVPGLYKYEIQAANYAPGTYSVSIYGNAFPAFLGQFVLKP